MEQRLNAIEIRNKQVELDKAWETSFTRRGSIALITYVTAAIFLVQVLKHENWYLDACVPVVGYLLSTLSLPWLKTRWQNAMRSRM